MSERAGTRNDGVALFEEHAGETPEVRKQRLAVFVRACRKNLAFAEGEEAAIKRALRKPMKDKIFAGYLNEQMKAKEKVSKARVALERAEALFNPLV